MTETMDQKITRLKKEREESNKRINKLLAEHDVMRTTRYQDKRAKLLHELTLDQYHLEKLDAQAEPIRKRIVELKEQIKQLDSDHENNLDHCFMDSGLRDGGATA